jgi:O-methyltransferase
MTQKIKDLVAKNTLVDWPRLEVLKEQLERTSVLPGVVAEVGVYKGGTALWILGHTKKLVYLFDTFTGMPKVSDKDLHHEGDFSDTSFEAVFALLQLNQSRSFFLMEQGLFPSETAEGIVGERFSFVHLDVDIYTSVRDSLEFFWPRVVDGGVIILDDYNEPNCPGAKLAGDEFAENMA